MYENKISKQSLFEVSQRAAVSSVLKADLLLKWILSSILQKMLKNKFLYFTVL